MRTSGWIFLIVSWVSLAWWMAFCFWRILRPQRRKGHETPTATL